MARPLPLRARSSLQPEKNTVGFSTYAASSRGEALGSMSRRSTRFGRIPLCRFCVARSRTNLAGAFRSLRSGNQFEQLLRIIEPLPHLLLVTSQRRGSQLCRYAGFLQATICSYETDLIDA